MAADHPLFLLLADIAARHDLVIDLHLDVVAEDMTVELSRRLLETHPNLYMSIRMGPGRAPQNHPLTGEGRLRPEWLTLLQDFPDRFVLGGDQFIASPAVRGTGPGMAFGQRAPIIRQRTRMLLDALPPDLARKIGYENAIRLYRLKE